MKLSSDNLLSNDVLNSSNNANANNNNNNNLSHTDSPHNARPHQLLHLKQQQQQEHHHYVNVSPHHGHLNLNNNNNNNNSSSSQQQQPQATRKHSSNNLLNDYDSPKPNHAGHGPLIDARVTMSASASISCRLSTDRLLNGSKVATAGANNNMSNNNLSTSASLLDATNDDAMSVGSPFEAGGRQRNGGNDSGHGILNSASSGTCAVKKVNKRTARITELFETEKRFVNILQTIIQVGSGLLFFFTENELILIS
jgi:hypothetical protein